MTVEHRAHVSQIPGAFDPADVREALVRHVQRRVKATEARAMRIWHALAG
jgi:hypothetical protein